MTKNVIRFPSPAENVRDPDNRQLVVYRKMSRPMRAMTSAIAWAGDHWFALACTAVLIFAFDHAMDEDAERLCKQTHEEGVCEQAGVIQ